MNHLNQILKFFSQFSKFQCFCFHGYEGVLLFVDCCDALLNNLKIITYCCHVSALIENAKFLRPFLNDFTVEVDYK